jgi:prepilin-type processing-associated H-X9-DG protein
MANLPDSQNYVMQVVGWQWVSMPEIVHLQGGNLSFADGHCEHWTWLERNTFQWVPLAGSPGTPDVGPADKDFARVAGAYSTPLSGRGEF